MSHPSSTFHPPQGSSNDRVGRTEREQSVTQVQHHAAWIEQLMHTTMREGEHYGRIVGFNVKPTLFKPGAEKLLFALRWVASYQIKESHLQDGHRDYQVVCTLSDIFTCAAVGQGLGLCSTLDSRYRYQGNGVEPTEQSVPTAYWDARLAGDDRRMAEALGSSELTVTKTESGWRIAKRHAQNTENPDITDTYNTVLKMAKKRALVDAVLTATASSDLFTQDLHDCPVEPASSADQSSPVVPSDHAPTVAEATIVPADDASTDFRDICVHFGKNRGLTLAELTKQQIHWYETDWLPKREQSGLATSEDRVLMRALKTYQGWREAEQAQEAKWQRAA